MEIKLTKEQQKLLKKRKKKKAKKAKKAKEEEVHFLRDMEHGILCAIVHE